MAKKTNSANAAATTNNQAPEAEAKVTELSRFEPAVERHFLAIKERVEGKGKAIQAWHVESAKLKALHEVKPLTVDENGEIHASIDGVEVAHLTKEKGVWFGKPAAKWILEQAYNLTKGPSIGGGKAPVDIGAALAGIKSLIAPAPVAA